MAKKNNTVFDKGGVVPFTKGVANFGQGAVKRSLGLSSFQPLESLGRLNNWAANALWSGGKGVAKAVANDPLVRRAGSMVEGGLDWLNPDLNEDYNPKPPPDESNSQPTPPQTYPPQTYSSELSLNKNPDRTFSKGPMRGGAVRFKPQAMPIDKPISLGINPEAPRPIFVTGDVRPVRMGLGPSIDDQMSGEGRPFNAGLSIRTDSRDRMYNPFEAENRGPLNINGLSVRSNFNDSEGKLQSDFMPIPKSETQPRSPSGSFGNLNNPEFNRQSKFDIDDPTRPVNINGPIEGAIVRTPYGDMYSSEEAVSNAFAPRSAENQNFRDGPVRATPQAIADMRVKGRKIGEDIIARNEQAFKDGPKNIMIKTGEDGKPVLDELGRPVEIAVPTNKYGEPIKQFTEEYEKQGYITKPKSKSKSKKPPKKPSKKNSVFQPAPLRVLAEDFEESDFRRFIRMQKENAKKAPNSFIRTSDNFGSGRYNVGQSPFYG